MELVRTVAALGARADAARAAGRRVALVPTMGALHKGHLALVAEARRRAELVIVSIFVNPTQFAPNEDLASYPRDLDGDVAKCRAAGVDVVFAPAPAELYPEGAQTWVEVGELAKPLCGASRPHFFRGVATVVAKLFAAARPHVAVFGEKDYQQLQVVKRLARDLLLGVEVVGVPTAREPDGLARSSRNVYLDAAMRGEALALVRALDAAEALARTGERSPAALLETAHKELLRAPHADVDYVELRDAETLAAVAALDRPAVLALAVRFPAPRAASGAVRLIDNRVLRPGSQEDPR
ncbi:MAG: pantoate--beta-alanine ligase [Proteobacteria bacterium]|nr:MAG: pantoate--beta-alanine ligase [Pseudomonadota bacterium]